MSWGSFFKNVVEAVAPTPQSLSGLRPSPPEPAPSHAYRVLKVGAAASSTGNDVKNDCPAALAGLEPFYDYLVSVDGIELTPDTAWLSSYVTRGAQDAIRCVVFSIKGQYRRLVVLPPQALTSTSWGVHLRWSPVQPSLDNVFHVLDVTPASPAWSAGLLEDEDYIIGTDTGVVRGESGLSELFQEHTDRQLELWVWNRYTDITRSVVITPTRHWGGRGIVGCGIGTGALHRLPRPLANGAPAKEGETVFSRLSIDNTGSFQSAADIARDGQPAPTPAPTTGSGGGGGRGRKSKYVNPESAPPLSDTPTVSSAGGRDAVSSGPPPKASISGVGAGGVGGFGVGGGGVGVGAPPKKRDATTTHLVHDTTERDSSEHEKQQEKGKGLSEADIDAMLADDNAD